MESKSSDNIKGIMEGAGNLSESSSTSENGKPSSKSKTIIIRCPDDDIQLPYVRRCASCLKRIHPEYNFTWEFMEFCNIVCISKYQGLNFKCMYCSRFINNTLFGKFYLRIRNIYAFFCSLPCMEYYKLNVKCCTYCERDISNTRAISTIVTDVNNVSFCSQTCCDIYNDVLKNNPPKIPPNTKCCVCQQDKSITTLFQHDGKLKYFCNQRCVIAYSFVKLKESEQCKLCQNYFTKKNIEGCTVYYDNESLIFCSKFCQHIYMSLNGKIVSCCWCRNKRNNFGMIRKYSCNFQNAYLCSVNCFKFNECGVAIIPVLPKTPQQASDRSAEIIPICESNQQADVSSSAIPNQISSARHSDGEINMPSSLIENNQFFIQSKKIIHQRNVATMCFIPKADKNIAVQPDMVTKAIQTNKAKLTEIVLPTPVPIYVPLPMAMYALPVPMPIPFTLPIPVPVFIPITSPTYTKIMSENSIIQNRIPDDPCEAELLEIADIIAEEKENMEQPQHSCTNQNLLEKQNNLNLNKDLSCSNELKGRKRSIDTLELCETEGRKKSYLPTSTDELNLNYSLGLNAFQQWVNAEAKHKNSHRTDILQMLPDQLCLALYSFIKGLKKPNGFEYAPDTMYYLCLGVQFYLNKKGRSDNIFFDKSYDKFCVTLNKIAKKFNTVYDMTSHFIVTRVEEEHLWETSQLGCYSPQVLLNTLVYFNTKYYHCLTVEEHKDITFFHVLKSKQAKSKCIILRFHKKKSKGEKHVYEQHQNPTRPDRCPVKLYEFYLSKCPESVRGSKNMFYLQPEQYCISDSPLWYTNSPVSNDALEKMINRIKMVKEVNMSLLKSK